MRKTALLILILLLLFLLPISTVYSHSALYDQSLEGFTIKSVAYISVPFHYQIKNYYCGPAALEMVFDYYGNDIDQVEIAEVARTYPTTYKYELRRAAHFSNLSTSYGDEMFDNITGYSDHKIGLAAFERTGLTIDDLKSLINKEEPVIILMWYSLTETYGHYRVVVGYNDTHVIMHDPWNIESWGGPYGGANTSMTYSTFSDLWVYSGYWGLWIHPWEIELQMPDIVNVGDVFEVVANITYSSSRQLDAIYFPASFCRATIKLSKGLELISGETPHHSLGNVTAGDSILTSWLVNASDDGFHSISIKATGIVEGHVEAHGTYLSYSYEDMIGGSGGTPTPNVFITPKESVASVGETLNLNVNISNANGVFSWETKIRFNPALLVVSAVQSGGFLSRAAPTFPLQFANHSDFGYVVLGETLSEEGSTDGNGTLVEITFKVLGIGECKLQLYDALLFNVDLNEIAHETTDGSFTSIKTLLTLNPQAVSVETGETFNVNIICSKVESLYLYQIFLNFSKEVLEIVNITKANFLSRGIYGTFWHSKWYNDKGYAQVWESMLFPNPPVDGTGELFKIAFKVKKTGSCKLHLYSTQLIDSYSVLIPHETRDGMVSAKEVLGHLIAWEDATYHVKTESNSSITAFNFSRSGKTIFFNISGENGNIGYVNVTIPKALLDTDIEQPPYQWLVLIDANPTAPKIITNTTHTCVYLSYAYGQHKIAIVGNKAVPEVPTLIILPLFIVATLLVIIICKFLNIVKPVASRAGKYYTRFRLFHF